VYGSVAAVPIFLFWLFVSWTLLLFGARLAYVFQYRGTLVARGPRGDSAVGRELVAGQALLAIARAFDGAEPAPDAGELAMRIGASADETSEAVAALRQRGVVLGLADGGLVPARSLEKITLLDVRRAVGGPDEPLGGVSGLLPGILRNIEGKAAEELAAISLRQLCDEERGSPLTRDGRSRLRDEADPESVPAAPARS
jgi:membrane protein